MANSVARSSLDVGSVIADTYTIEALIGQGGMGSVFLASHTRLPGKRVAIKLLHVELSGDDVIARFRREALIASQLSHPNIVRVDDYNVTDDGTPYLVLEYLEGESLAQRLKAGPLPLEQAMSILRMIGSAMAVAHREGIVHRDLKPQNIFLVPTEIEGELVEIAKVLDFGISKMRGSTTVKTQESTLLGTPQYMAPEQATGQHAAVDERTDVFALGAIVYEMLTGKPAFSGENIPEVVFKVVYEQPAPLGDVAPPPVVAAVEKAMQKKQDDRFPTVVAFVEAVTGRPLVPRTSMTSVPPGARIAKPTTTTTGKQASGAAFANTVDSASLAKPAVSPLAETVASQQGGEPAPAPPAQRPRGLMLGSALAGVLAIGVIGAYLAMRAPEKKRVVAVAADAAAVEIDAVPVVAIDAAIDIDAPIVAIDAAAVTPDAAKKTPALTVPKASDDPKAQEYLDNAEVAYRDGNIDLAFRLCNSVENSPSASEVQRSKALVLRGIIDCVDKHDIGRAQADLRAIPLAAYKSRLIAKCAALK